jgi:hypothetical protein
LRPPHLKPTHPQSHLHKAAILKLGF